LKIRRPTGWWVPILNFNWREARPRASAINDFVAGQRNVQRESVVKFEVVFMTSMVVKGAGLAQAFAV
jgi:hypothetical protein